MGSLRRRPIDPFRAVCIHDSAVMALPEKLLKAWMESERDYSVIASAIEALDVKPAVFVCDPLRPEYDAASVSGAMSDIKIIFAAHVRDIQNTDESMKPEFVVRDDRKFITQEYLDTIPTLWLADISGQIMRTGLGSVDPFTFPAGFWQRRARAEIKRLAQQASTAAHTSETAKSQAENA